MAPNPKRSDKLIFDANIRVRVMCLVIYHLMQQGADIYLSEFFDCAT